MAFYDSRAEWLEARSRDHFEKLGSLTIRTTDAYFMGKVAAHGMLEKEALSFGGITAMMGRVGQVARRGAQAVGQGVQKVQKGISGLSHQTSAPTVAATPRALSKTVIQPRPQLSKTVAQPQSQLSQTVTQRPNLAATRIQQGSRPGYVEARTMAATPPSPKTMIQPESMGFARTSPSSPGVTMSGATGRGTVGGNLVQNQQVTPRSQRSFSATYGPEGQRRIDFSTPEGKLEGRKILEGARRDIPDAPLSKATLSRTPTKSQVFPTEAQGPAPFVSKYQGGPLPPPESIMQMNALRGAGLSEGTAQQVMMRNMSGRDLGQSMRGTGRIQSTSRLEGWGEGPGGQRIPLYRPMTKVDAHKLNAVLLDIIEHSKPGALIKHASLRATLDDDGMLKVASENSYWLSARGECHLDFLAGVYDTNQDMAWTFAKNAGLSKEASILSGLGRAAGWGARQVTRGVQGVGHGAGWTARQAGKVKSMYRAPLQSSVARFGEKAPTSNPFARAKERVTTWKTGVAPGTEGPAINPLRRTGREMGAKVKQELRTGYKAGLHPQPKPAAPPAGAASDVGPGPHRSAPAPGPEPAAPPPSAPASTEAATAVEKKPGLVERGLVGTGKTLRNLGYGAMIGVPLVAAAGIGAAGKILERNPAPYQYGMGAPQTWNFPQQM